MEKVHLTSDMLKSFSSKGEMVAWLKKVRLVATLLPEDDKIDRETEIQ